ncbi:MAG: hypothetical protein IJE92_01205 [Clostridia bacterium]|nr:hypothetical protein [Clostridia bacterium]
MEEISDITKLDTPVIRLEEVINTTAVLGQAILGQAILGSGGTDLTKLATPVIRLETVSDLVKLDTPIIRLEEISDIPKLDTPSIYLETVSDLTKLATPSIYMETVEEEIELTKLDTPVIRLEEEEEVTGVTLSITFPAVEGTTNGYSALGSTYYHSLDATTSYSGYDAYSTCVIDGVTIRTTNTVISSSKISTDTTIYREATFNNGVLTIKTDASKRTSDSTPVEVSADAYTTTAEFFK